MKLVIEPSLRRALRAGGPVVALETALLSFGLPYPQNVEVLREMAAAVSSAGALPAPIAVHAGRIHVGLPDSLIELLAHPSPPPRSRTRAAAAVHKCARRDLGWILARGAAGATTVSSTLDLAHRAGIRVFATGGIGGVHPSEGSLDVSADLATMSEVPLLLVSTGVKSICDPVATAEVLEALSVPVLGYRTDRFPHFYAGESPVAIPRIESPADAARAYRAYRDLESSSTLLIANPVPPEHQLPAGRLARLADEGAQAAAAAGVSGNALTPFLLDYLAKRTRGKTVAANRALLLANARLAGEIAVALSR